MSDEEKKAMERIDYIQDFIIENGQYNADVNDMEYFSKILNLIEKQSIKIEEYNTKLLNNAGIYQLGFNDGKKSVQDKIKAKIEEKFLEAKGLYERGVQPQAQYTMKLLRDLEKSLLEKE